MWLKLRQGDVSTIHHPSRLHEQVQVHSQQQLVKIDKFLITLGAWVGGNSVCHLKLEEGAADQLFCLRFDGRYRVRLAPFIGLVKVNGEEVGTRGAVLDVGDILECGPYIFQLVPKPSSHDRRGPLARPDTSIVLEEGDAGEPIPVEESHAVKPPPRGLQNQELAKPSQPPVPTQPEHASEKEESPAAEQPDVDAQTVARPDAEPATRVVAYDTVGVDTTDRDDLSDVEGGAPREQQSSWSSEFENAFVDDLDDEAETGTLVVHEAGEDSDFDDMDLDDIEGADSSVSLSLATASRLRSQDSDGEISVADAVPDVWTGDGDDYDMSSSRSAWRRPRFATAGQTVEPFVVAVPFASEAAVADEFADVRQRITKYIDDQDYAAVVLDFHQIRNWSPSLTPELIQLCEAIESRGGLCAASRLDVDFLTEFQNSGLPECFTLYPTTERAIASLT